MSNPYLLAQTAKFESLKTSIEGLQTRAAEEARDLTEDELVLVRSQGDEAKKLAETITQLSEIETRNAKVAALAAKVTDNGTADTGKTETRSLGTSNTTAKDRDPGHYRSAKDNGQYSFFGDMYAARHKDDEAAAKRLAEHQRAALTTGANGPGLVQPHWMTEEFETLARQGRKLANAVRNIPLGDDPRPLTLPKQTVGTDTAVAEQTNENDPLADADTYDTDVDTVTPKPTAGKQTMSRQLLDMSSPAIDQLIYADLMEVYNSKVELKVGTALITAAGTAVTTFATEAAFKANNGGDALDAVIDAEIAVLDARKVGADVLAMRTRRWGAFKKFKDTTGRPLIPGGSGGPVNVAGVGDVNSLGMLEDLPIIVSEGLGTTAYAESMLAFKASDQVLFESNILRFRFEEVSGPESVILGIWGYTGFISRQAGKSVKRIVITAA